MHKHSSFSLLLGKLLSYTWEYSGSEEVSSFRNNFTALRYFSIDSSLVLSKPKRENSEIRCSKEPWDPMIRCEITLVGRCHLLTRLLELVFCSTYQSPDCMREPHGYTTWHIWTDGLTTLPEPTTDIHVSKVFRIPGLSLWTGQLRP